MTDMAFLFPAPGAGKMKIMKGAIFGQWDISDSLRSKLLSFGFSLTEVTFKKDLNGYAVIFLPYTTKSFLFANTLFNESAHVHVVLVGTDINSSDEDALQSLMGFNPPRLLTLGTQMNELREKIVTQRKPTKKSRPVRIRKPLPQVTIPYTALSFILLAGLLSLFLPFLMLATALGSGAGSMYFAKRNLSAPSKVLLSVSSATASISKTFFTLLGPLNPNMEYFSQVAQLTYDGSSILRHFYTTEATGKLLASAFLSKADTLHVGTLTKDLLAVLNDLYRDTSFWSVNSQAVLSAVAVPQLGELHTYLKLIPTITPLLQNAPLLSGEDKPTTYLVLLQNNMELRPTGGFIGSFALFTVEKGKIKSREVYDVYDADGKLAGFVTPPDPIKQYLREPSWHMRDSNWDPDFPTSAKRALWFLDKTMNRTADVVVAVDLSFVKSLLRVTGPLEVVGFSETVDEHTLYEKAQSHAEKDFFPGSTAKKTYLAALTESLLARVQNSDSDSQKKVLLSMFDQFDGRSVQMWSSNEKLSQALHSISWDGSFEPKSCGDFCKPILSSIIEANLGVSKSNISITRSLASSFQITDESLQVTTELTLTHDGKYRNNGNEDYRVYVRSLAPIGSQFENVRVSSGGELSVLPAEVKETQHYQSGGAFVVVKAGTTSTVSFTYTLPLSADILKLEFQWIKQSGVDPYAFTLTDSGGHVYNTSLRARYTLDTVIK